MEPLGPLAMGFGAGVRGGSEMYVVTDPSDDKENPKQGTLRHATKCSNRWIVFDKPMEIRLVAQLWIKSHTTIDGRGHKIVLLQGQVVVGKAEDVIIHNIEVRDIEGDADALHIYNGSKKVWVDHCSFSHAVRGLTTVIGGSTDVTFSYNLYQDNNFVMLLGGADDSVQDKIIRVTVYRNYFKHCTQRMPHIRFGLAHACNNIYENWNSYCLGGRVQGTLLSEANVFNPGSTKKEVTPWWPNFDKAPTSDGSATILSAHDALLYGSTFHEFKNGSWAPLPYALEVLPTVNLWGFLANNVGPRY